MPRLSFASPPSTSSSWRWSPLQALIVIMKSFWGAIGFDFYVRNKLLTRWYITQKKKSLGNREIIYLAAHEKGTEQPCLLFHDTAGSSLDWRSLFKNRPEKLGLFAMERPGFGPAPDRPPVLEADMDLSSHVLREITQDGKKAVLVGHSLGGSIATYLAAHDPDFVAGLVLVNAALDPALEKIHPFQKYFLRGPLSWFLTKALRNSNRELVQYPAFLEKLQPRLKDIRCPVTIIQSFNDRLVSYQNVDYMRKHFTNAPEINIIYTYSGGHFLNRTRADLIKEALESYAA